MNFRRTDFQLFKELLDEIPWEVLLRDKGVEQRWQLLKDAILRAQELLILWYKKSSREGTASLAQLSKDLPVKLRKNRDSIPYSTACTHDMGRAQGCHLDVQQWDQEDQGVKK